MMSKQIIPLLERALLPSGMRHFSMTSASDSESESAMRPKLDPLRKQMTDFLKNTSQYEDQVKDTLSPYFFKSGERLPGYATEAGTDAYYRRS